VCPILPIKLGLFRVNLLDLYVFIDVVGLVNKVAHVLPPYGNARS
jgi:hypothetical protein